jgi:serine/threonine protein kinase
MFEQIAHYRILEPIGSMSNGEYRARDTRTGRTVRIVLLLEEAAGDNRRDELFRAGRAASALSHPNIAALYEIGEDRGRVFLAFEFVAGETLTSAIGGRPMNVRRALDLGAQVADALAEAVAADIPHRHVTAADVVITPAGRAKIVNLGVAPWLKAPRAAIPAAEHDEIGALGALLAEMLTGAPPNGAAPSSINSAVPREVDRIVAKALASEAGHRFASPATVAAALRSAVAALDARRASSERGRI